MNNRTANVTIKIHATPTQVWEALTSPEIIKQYMVGTNAISEWKEGSPIVFKGEWESKTYEDKGTILRIEPERLLSYTHFSPLSGVPDVPENYHTVTFALSPEGSDTVLSLSQDNNTSEESRERSEKMWKSMLETMKKLLEHN